MLIISALKSKLAEIACKLEIPSEMATQNSVNLNLKNHFLRNISYISFLYLKS